MFRMHATGTLVPVSKNKPKNISGPRIRRLRLRRGWTEERLAAEVTAAGISMDASAVRRIEARKRKLFDKDILVLAECLRTTTHQLVTGRDRKTVQ